VKRAKSLFFLGLAQLAVQLTNKSTPDIEFFAKNIAAIYAYAKDYPLPYYYKRNLKKL
jgi:hypothetical protein